METNVVRVRLWDMVVGYLSWDKKGGIANFEYESSFLEQGLDIAPLTMPINSVRSKKGLPWVGERDKLYQGLPPMIADSLPDKWGNSLFVAWLRDNNISTMMIIQPILLQNWNISIIVWLLMQAFILCPRNFAVTKVFHIS